MVPTMGTKFGPPYFVGFLEVTFLFPVKLPKYFPRNNCDWLRNYSKNIDDGFLTWHSTLDLNVLKNVLNNLRPTLKLQ